MNQKNAEYDLSTRERLDQENRKNWKNAIARAYKYAMYKTKYLAILDYKLNPDDLVSEAIARAYGEGTGKYGKKTYRNWNTDKYPSLAKFLISIIRSLVDHIIKEHVGYNFLTLESENDKETATLEFEINKKLASKINPDEKLLILERAISLLQFLEKLSQDDPDIGMLLLAAEEGHSKASVQAEVMGYDVQEVYNIRRRLRRKLSAFLPTHSN